MSALLNGVTFNSQINSTSHKTRFRPICYSGEKRWEMEGFCVGKKLLFEKAWQYIVSNNPGYAPPGHVWDSGPKCGFKSIGINREEIIERIQIAQELNKWYRPEEPYPKSTTTASYLTSEDGSVIFIKTKMFGIRYFCIQPPILFSNRTAKINGLYGAGYDALFNRELIAFFGFCGQYGEYNLVPGVAKRFADQYGLLKDHVEFPGLAS